MTRDRTDQFETLLLGLQAFRSFLVAELSLWSAQDQRKRLPRKGTHVAGRSCVYACTGLGPSCATATDTHGSKPWLRSLGGWVELPSQQNHTLGAEVCQGQTQLSRTFVGGASVGALVTELCISDQLREGSFQQYS